MLVIMYWISLSDRQLNNRLKIFGKTVAGRVDIDTGDLAQPLRQTSYSDLDISFTALAARTDVYKYSFLPRDASAERGYEIACRPSVCLSVCLSVRHDPVSWSYRLEFFENNFTAE